MSCIRSQVSPALQEVPYPETKWILFFLSPWEAGVRTLQSKAAFPGTSLPAIYLFFYAFVGLSVCHFVRCQVVPWFPLPSTSFDTTPRVTIVQTPATEEETQLYGLLHVLFFKDICLILVLFRFVVMHAWNILMFIFLSVPFLCFTSVMPCSKAPALFIVQKQGFQIDTGILFEMAWGTFSWLSGRKYLHLISKLLSCFLLSRIRMNRLSLKVL